MADSDEKSGKVRYYPKFTLVKYLMQRDFRRDFSAKETDAFQKLNSYHTTANDKEKSRRYSNNNGRNKQSLMGSALKRSL